jgi:hypothetical protein
METKQMLVAELEGMKNRLMSEKADLEVAHNNMNKVKEFQFLRTNDEKGQQIHDQSMKIQILEMEISALEKRIAEKTESLNQVNAILTTH